MKRLATVLWKTLVHSRHSDAHLRGRRILFLLLFLPAYALLEAWNWLCLGLDEIFFPRYRNVVVTAPVFITGIPRSGTTFLHRLLARDRETFTSMTTWEMTLAPAICQKKLARALAILDKTLGHPLRKLILALEAKTLAHLRTMHPLGFFEAEEDEVILIHRFSSIYLYLLFPTEELMAFGFFDERIEERTKRRNLQFYRRCVQRHLYHAGPEKRFLSKNPAFSAKLTSLKSTFPDALFLYPIRQPARTIPSGLSLLAYLYSRFCHIREVATFQELTLALLTHWHEHPLQIFQQWNPETFMVLPFKTLTREPSASVTQIYLRLGLPVREDYRALLLAEDKASRSYQSRHRYDDTFTRDIPLAWQTRLGQAYEQLLRLAEEGHQ
ncbi:MAG: sulfotransferase [Bacteroidia bacterium]|nr:sulfotransferase [Bacteroidia bacterium]